MLTTPQVIDALGGNKIVAEMFGVGSSAVSNWRRSGFPPRLHLQVFRTCQERGIEYDPADADESEPATDPAPLGVEHRGASVSEGCDTDTARSSNVHQVSKGKRPVAEDPEAGRPGAAPVPPASDVAPSGAAVTGNDGDEIPAGAGGEDEEAAA